MSSNRAGGTSLVEVVVAIALLALVVLGLASGVLVAQKTASVTSEREAAIRAALSILANISENTGDKSTMGGGFGVNGGPDGTGGYIFGLDDGTLAVNKLKPAVLASPLWDTAPTPRNGNASAAELLMAGWVTVTQVAGRTSLFEVTATVCWKTTGTTSTRNEERVTFATLVRN